MNKPYIKAGGRYETNGSLLEFRCGKHRYVWVVGSSITPIKQLDMWDRVRNWVLSHFRKKRGIIFDSSKEAPFSRGGFFITALKITLFRVHQFVPLANFFV